MCMPLDENSPEEEGLALAVERGAGMESGVVAGICHAELMEHLRLERVPGYHFANDPTVPKLKASYHRNAPGPFYVSDQCIICALPVQTAPENFAWDCEVGCEGCPHSCYVKKQPENDEELRKMIEVVLAAETENVRYCGTNPWVIEKFRKFDMERVCDALRGRDVVR